MNKKPGRSLIPYNVEGEPAFVTRGRQIEEAMDLPEISPLEPAPVAPVASPEPSEPSEPA